MGCLRLTYNTNLDLVKNEFEKELTSNKSDLKEQSAYFYGFQGMEKDDKIKGEGNSYTTEFRQYDPRVGRWLSIDPLEYVFPWQSPYVALDNNPILLIDPNGDSTFVESNMDGTYNVVGGNLDGDDKGIYLMLNGRLTDMKVGESLTTHSFVDGNDKFVIGATIDPNDESGQDFVDNEIIGGNPSLLWYVINSGRHQGDHDFKTRGEDKDWSSDKKNQHRYRGSVTKDGKFGSARDFGNIGAGIMAGRRGLNWEGTRRQFDGYQGSKEPLVSVKAQEIGWKIGYKIYTGRIRIVYDDWKSNSLKYERE